MVGQTEHQGDIRIRSKRDPIRIDVIAHVVGQRGDVHEFHASLVGVMNGVLFAILIGAIAYIWFGDGQLGLVIAAAMIVNMMCAALAGILIPLTLKRFDIDSRYVFQGSAGLMFSRAQDLLARRRRALWPAFDFLRRRWSFLLVQQTFH